MSRMPRDTFCCDLLGFVIQSMGDSFYVTLVTPTSLVFISIIFPENYHVSSNSKDASHDALVHFDLLPQVEKLHEQTA